MDPITSLQNPKVKGVVRLRNRRERDETGLFLIEGYRELLRATEANVVVDTVFFCPPLFLGENEEGLIRATNATAIPCSESVFRKLSYRDRPDGLLAIAKQWRRGLCDLDLTDNPFLVVAEAIEKPGNLGTILRSSDGVGVDGLIVCDQCTDLFNPNVVRASVGTLFHVPTVEASTQDLIAFAKEKGISLVAATPHAEKNYTQTDLSGAIALLIGTEQLGLSDALMDAADIHVALPMCGAADSLNAAMATTVLLYEALRQRTS